MDVESFPREMHLYLLDGTKKNAAISRSRNQLYSESSLFNAYASLLPEGGIFALTIVPNSIRATRLLSYSDPQGMTSEIEPFLHVIPVGETFALGGLRTLAFHTFTTSSKSLSVPMKRSGMV